MKFKDKRTNKINTAFSIVEEDSKIYINFTENGKKYTYNKENIEIINDLDFKKEISSSKIMIYSMEQVCYKCKKQTEILTYLLFDDSTLENLVYPWNKSRLNSIQSNELLMCHMANPEIEFYPILIIGGHKKLDKILLNMFSDRIQLKYSNTQKRRYAMNICQNCGAQQGEFFIYERINTIIKNMKQLPIYSIVDNKC